MTRPDAIESNATPPQEIQAPSGTFQMLASVNGNLAGMPSADMLGTFDTKRRVEIHRDTGDPGVLRVNVFENEGSKYYPKILYIFLINEADIVTGLRSERIDSIGEPRPLPQPPFEAALLVISTAHRRQPRLNR